MDWAGYRHSLQNEISRLIEADGLLKASPTWDLTSCKVEARNPGTGQVPFSVHFALQNGQVVAGIVREGERPVPGRPWSSEDRSFFSRDINAKFPPGLLYQVENESLATAKTIRAAATQAPAGPVASWGEPLPDRMARMGRDDGLLDAKRSLDIRPGGAARDVAGGSWQIVDDRGEVMEAVQRSVMQRRPPETLVSLLAVAQAAYDDGRTRGMAERMGGIPELTSAEPEGAPVPAFR